MEAPFPCVTQRDLAKHRVMCWRLWADKSQRPVCEVAIPSHARPEELCRSTLALLREHGVDLSRVHVFVDFEWISADGSHAYDLYVRVLRRHGFHAVHVRPGGAGLDGNMRTIRTFFEIGTYMIVMSDRVDDVMESSSVSRTVPILKPLPKGSLLALWHHGYDLLQAGEFAAWSTNASHSPRTMRHDFISRKAGLLDGNMTGQVVTQALKDMNIEHGLIYDVEYAASLWDLGYRYLRYRGVCCKHPYRSAGGQSDKIPDPAVRRRAEDAAIKAVAKKYPEVVKFVRKTSASLKVMNYSFRQRGPQVLKVIQRHGHGSGRPRRYAIDRAATRAERTAACRARQRKGSS